MNLTIIDFNRTIYDPEQDRLIDGALELLETLSRRMPIVLVSKKEASRPAALERLGIANFFCETVFTGQKTPELFMEIVRRHGATPEETLVIGDYIPSEIACGNKIGAYTVHFSTGTFADRLFEGMYMQPRQTITHLSEVMAFLD